VLPPALLSPLLLLLPGMLLMPWIRTPENTWQQSSRVPWEL
jgi:hypothetical protein